MATLAELRNRVRDRYGILPTDTGLTDAVLTSMVNSALRQISLESDWPWLVASPNTIITAPGLGDYPLPENFLRVIDVSNPSDGYRLARVPIATIDTYTADRQSRPRWYAITGNTLALAPIPDQVYTLQVRYYQTENTLVAPTDTPRIPDAYDEGVVDMTAYYAFIAARQPEKAATAQSAYNAWLARIRDNVNRDQTPLRPYIRPGGI